jgi:hypothetical protein
MAVVNLALIVVLYGAIYGLYRKGELSLYESLVVSALVGIAIK